MASIPASYFVYTISRPGKDGELTTFGKWIEKWSDLSKEWEEKNHANTRAIEQAAADKHLFYHIERNRHVELKYPEYVHISWQTPEYKREWFGRAS